MVITFNYYIYFLLSFCVSQTKLIAAETILFSLEKCTYKMFTFATLYTADVLSKSCEKM